jgi:hypothetical protein
MKLARNYASEPRVHEAMRGGISAEDFDWPLPHIYEGDGFSALVGREYCGGRKSDPLRWHISVRGPGRIPTWEELVEIGHQLRPGVFFVVMVPPRSWWLNVHEHVLHLWQVNDDALVEEARANAMRHAPT